MSGECVSMRSYYTGATFPHHIAACVCACMHEIASASATVSNTNHERPRALIGAAKDSMICRWLLFLTLSSAMASWHCSTSRSRDTMNAFLRVGVSE